MLRPAYPVAATIKGIIYVVGGGSSTSTTTVQAYNVATNTWSIRKALPASLSGMNGASAISGRLYVTGGYGSRALLVYDPTNNTWIRKADMPDEGFYGAQGVIGGRLYVYAAATFGPPKLFRYTPATNRWKELARPYETHTHPGAGVISGKFYVVGGQDDVYETRPYLDVYDPATNTWTSKAPMPMPVKAMASAVLNGKLYVAGGIEPPVPPTWEESIVATLLVYEPVSNRWTRKASMPTARAYAAGAATGGKFFVMGGVNALRKVEAYTP